jgi:hypothetical protein
MVSASGNTARLRFLAASLPAPGTAAVSTRMSDAPALVRERQRSLLAEHASPADRASADTSELPTAALFRRSGRITVESRACLVVLKLASLLGRREDSRAPTSPSDATRSWSTARSASAGTPGSPIRCPHPPRRRLQALPAERGGPGVAGPSQPPCWPRAIRAVRAWLAPWITLRRWWAAWSNAPPARQLQALMTSLEAGCGLPLYIPS